MSLHSELKSKIKEAMLAKDSVKLLVVRGLLASFTNELLAKKGKPALELTDEEALAIIRRSVKQHKDSIEQFRKGGRKELVSAEEAELSILEAYLPKMMSGESLKKLAVAKKTELGITDKSKTGMLMSALMKELKGKADGALVKKVVEELF